MTTSPSEVSIHQYLNVRQAYGATVRSDGRKLAFLSNITGFAQIWQIDLPIEHTIPWPDQLTFSPDRLMDAQFSPVIGHNHLVFSQDSGGNENAQLKLLADGQIHELTAGFESALHFFGCWHPNGQSIAFAANRRDPALFDLYVQPLDGPAECIWKATRPGFPMWQAYSPDAKHLYFNILYSSREAALCRLELATGAVTGYQAGAGQERLSHIQIGGDGSVYCLSDNGTDFDHIVKISPDLSELSTFAAFDWDAGNLSMSPNGNKLAFTLNSDGYRIPAVIDIDSGAMQQAFQPDVDSGAACQLDGRLNWGPDDRHLYYSYTTAARTSDIYHWDLETGLVGPVTRSALGGLQQDSLQDFKLVRFESFDGLEIPAWFAQPQANSGDDLPALIMVHGGPEGQSAAAFNFLAQYFLASGFSVMLPNVRGSVGYGRAYAALDDVEKRLDSVADLAAAQAWLAAQPGVNPERISVYGGSYGGYMVLAALTEYPDLWAAGINIVGISNFVTFLENTSSYRRAHRETEYGSLEIDRPFLESISPIHKVNRIRAPLMVIHGANDPRVPLSEAEQLVAALEALDQTVEYLVFADEGHGLAKLHNKRVAYPAIVKFLEQHG
jgi:dipeptidyl aminopeptidase/acylaminoacyl peptidase